MLLVWEKGGKIHECLCQCRNSKLLAAFEMIFNQNMLLFRDVICYCNINVNVTISKFRNMRTSHQFNYEAELQVTY